MSIYIQKSNGGWFFVLQRTIPGIMYTSATLIMGAFFNPSFGAFVHAVFCGWGYSYNSGEGLYRL